jgi:hypothetical protein
MKSAGNFLEKNGPVSLTGWWPMVIIGH